MTIALNEIKEFAENLYTCKEQCINGLKNSKAIGILCGAWGFTFCLHYRSWAWRFESVQDGFATSMDEITMIVLASTMFISIVAFILTLLMCLPKRN